jgi:hypothetical protein
VSTPTKTKEQNDNNNSQDIWRQQTKVFSQIFPIPLPFASNSSLNVLDQNSICMSNISSNSSKQNSESHGSYLFDQNKNHSSSFSVSSIQQFNKDRLQN